MFYVRLIVAIACFGFAGFIVYSLVNGYLKASGSRFRRGLVATQGSATILWSRFSMVIGLFTAGLANIADYMNLPGIGDALHEYLTPTTVSLIFAGSMIITELARRRSL